MNWIPSAIAILALLISIRNFLLIRRIVSLLGDQQTINKQTVRITREIGKLCGVNHKPCA